MATTDHFFYIASLLSLEYLPIFKLNLFPFFRLLMNWWSINQEKIWFECPSIMSVLSIVLIQQISNLIPVFFGFFGVQKQASYSSHAKPFWHQLSFKTAFPINYGGMRSKILLHGFVLQDQFIYTQVVFVSSSSALCFLSLQCGYFSCNSDTKFPMQFICSTTSHWVFTLQQLRVPFSPYSCPFSLTWINSWYEIS